MGYLVEKKVASGFYYHYMNNFESWITKENKMSENKVMVETREDGIYIRMAGNPRKSECFSYEWAKVKSF